MNHLRNDAELRNYYRTIIVLYSGNGFLKLMSLSSACFLKCIYLPENIILTSTRTNPSPEFNFLDFRELLYRLRSFETHRRKKEKQLPFREADHEKMKTIRSTFKNRVEMIVIVTRCYIFFRFPTHCFRRIFSFRDKNIWTRNIIFFISIMRPRSSFDVKRKIRENRKRGRVRRSNCNAIFILPPIALFYIHISAAPSICMLVASTFSFHANKMSFCRLRCPSPVPRIFTLPYLLPLAYI